MRQEFIPPVPTFLEENTRRQMERMDDESREEELKEEEVSEDHDDEDGGDDDDDDGLNGDEEEDNSAPQCQRVQLQAAALSTEQQKKKNGDAAAASCPNRKCVPGIVYLGYIPPRLRPRHVRNLLASHGEIGRIFLQPEGNVVRRRKRKAGLKGKGFTEGWVEFRDKRVAKRVVLSLNNTPMGAKKHNRFHSDLWCMKYLHRFHWTHLSERLAYEQTVLHQRLRTEVSQAKRETNFYLSSVEKSHNMAKPHRKGHKVQDKQWQFSQRQTEDEIQNRKKKNNKPPAVSQNSLRDKSQRHETKSQSNVSLLAKIFNSNQSQD